MHLCAVILPGVSSRGFSMLPLAGVLQRASFCMGLWGADVLSAPLLFPQGNKRLAGASGSAVHGGIGGCALLQAARTAEGLVKPCHWSHERPKV